MAWCDLLNLTMKSWDSRSLYPCVHVDQYSLPATNRTDVAVDIHGRPALSAAGIKLDAVGISVVPVIDNTASLPLSYIGLNGGANGEAKFRGDATGFKPLLEECGVKVLTNEDEAAVSLLALLPLSFKVSGEHHTDALEDKLLVFTLDGNDALVAVEIRTIFNDKSLDPALHHHDVHLTIDLTGYTRNRRVVRVFSVRIVEKFGLELKNALQVEGADVEELLGGDLAVLAAKDCGVRVDALEALLDHVELILVLRKVSLVENDL